MRVYETTFIVNPQTDDASIDQHVASVSTLITEHGGKLLHEDRMGTRRLAYPIKKLTQGYYHSFVYEAPSTVLPDLDRFFRLNEQYLRNLTVVFEGSLEKLTHARDDREAPLADSKAPAAPAATEAEASADADEKPAEEAAPAATETAEEAVETPEEDAAETDEEDEL